MHYADLLWAILNKNPDIFEPKREDTSTILHEFRGTTALCLANCPTKASLISWGETIVGCLRHRIYSNRFHRSSISLHSLSITLAMKTLLLLWSLISTEQHLRQLRPVVLGQLAAGTNDIEDLQHRLAGTVVTKLAVFLHDFQ